MPSSVTSRLLAANTKIARLNFTEKTPNNIFENAFFDLSPANIAKQFLSAINFKII